MTTHRFTTMGSGHNHHLGESEVGSNSGAVQEFLSQ